MESSPTNHTTPQSAKSIAKAKKEERNKRTMPTSLSKPAFVSSASARMRCFALSVQTNVPVNVRPSWIEIRKVLLSEALSRSLGEVVDMVAVHSTSIHPMSVSPSPPFPSTSFILTHTLLLAFPPFTRSRPNHPSHPHRLPSSLPSDHRARLDFAAL